MDTQEKKIYTAVLITCLVIGTVFFFLIISLYRQQRRLLKLQQQYNTAEINAMENERSRIAADLHDEISPLLMLAGIRISQIQSTMAIDSAIKNEVRDILTNSLKRIREISFDLIPATLLRQGLTGGIKELVSKITLTTNIKIAVIAIEDVHLPEEKAINIFRIVQEILFNVIKHSHATEVMILLEKTPELVILKIADNGQGLDYNHALKQSTGVGLRSIQNRVAIMNSKIFIKSGINQGLSYVFEIPLDPANSV